MVFLRSRSNTNNPKTVVITVNLPDDINLLDPKEESDLLSVTKSVTGSTTEKRSSSSRLIQIFSLLQGSYKETDDESTENNTSSEGSISSSSRCVDSLHEDVEGNYAVIVQAESVEDYFSTNYSAHEFDDRDDLLSDDDVEVDSYNTKDDARDCGGSDECNDSKEEINSEKPLTPPIPTYTSSFTKNEIFPSRPIPCPKGKPLSIKELRRTASNGSKNYVHVFHNQLKPLVEKPSEDNFDNDEFSQMDSNYDLIQNPSFSASFDEAEIRKRWTLSLEVMAKWGIIS